MLVTVALLYLAAGTLTWLWFWHWYQTARRALHAHAHPGTLVATSLLVILLWPVSVGAVIGGLIAGVARR